jgi:hypothetical protein
MMFFILAMNKLDNVVIPSLVGTSYGNVMIC